MTAEGLHPGLRAPFARCEAVRQDTTSLLSTLTLRDWNRRAGRRTWTVSEVFDHLVRAEIGTSKMVRRLIRGDYADAIRPPEVQLYDSSLAAYPYGRYPAPATLVPESVPLADAASRLDAAHQRFVEELGRFRGPDADLPASEDPDTGMWFTLAGWVRLQALHEAHHLEQIRILLGRG